MLRDLAEATAAGLLTGLGFIAPVAWWLAFPGFALLLHVLARAASPSRGAMLAFIAGFALYGLDQAPTYLSILPLDWFGIGNPYVQAGCAGAAWAAVVAALSIGPAAFGAFMCWLPYPRALSSRLLIVAPAAWVLSEWIAACAFSLLTWGPGSMLGAQFTFGALGYLLANDAALLQAAWLGGIYMLSFLAAFIGTGCYLAIAYRGRFERFALLAGACMLALLVLAGHAALGSARAQEHAHAFAAGAIPVAVLARYAPPAFMVGPDAGAADLAAATQLIAPLRGIRVLLFPEEIAYVRSMMGDRSGETRALIALLGPDGGPLIIDSENDGLGNGSLVEHAVFYQDGAIRAGQDKRLLVPVGEYVPYLLSGIARLLGGGALLSASDAARSYEPGPASGMGAIGAAVIGVRFCDEELSPALYRQEVRAGATVLADISSQGWFHSSRIVYGQLQLAAKVRAAETRRWFMQSGNMAPAFVLDAYGSVIAESAWGKTDALAANVLPRTDSTPYVVLGGWWLALCALLGIAGCLMPLRRHPPTGAR